MKRKFIDETDITKSSPLNDDVMKLSDGNMIYVDIKFMAKFSVLIKNLIMENKQDDELKNKIFLGDIETYKYIYKLIEHPQSADEYLNTNIDKLNGSSIIDTMVYLDVCDEFIMYEINHLILNKSLKWYCDISDKWKQYIISKTIMSFYFNNCQTSLIISSMFHIIIKLNLQKEVVNHIMENQKKYDEEFQQRQALLSNSSSSQSKTKRVVKKT